MLIGLTGGIASGKSTVSRLLVKHGALLVDADQVARDIVELGQPALKELSSFFGQAVLHEDGSLNRAALGAIVFSDKDKLVKLESITHPAIRTRMLSMIKQYQEKQPNAIIVADIPLLYETKQIHLYEAIVVVYVPRELQIERLVARNNVTLDAAISRIDIQMDIEQKRAQADYVIDNSGSLEQTEKQVVELIQRLVSV
ncbi:MAG TPA: dephospho-CoA kinase [Candidatus Paenibacillus intestinavium]|nr:dephospho-CoA kinase [Candidatus Paenibacillus intestinavium]